MDPAAKPIPLKRALLAAAALFAAAAMAHAGPCDDPLRGPAPRLVWDESPSAGAAAVARIEAAHGGMDLKALWWNVQRGEQNREFLSAGGEDPLSDNLAAIVGALWAPDVIVLAEYDTGERIFSPALQDRLLALYPFQRFEPYHSSEPAYGLFILSRRPVASLRQTAMGWVPTNLSRRRRADYVDRYTRDADGRALREAPYMTERPYVELVYDVGGQTAVLGFAHLVMPWHNLKDREGMVRSAYEMVWGRSNPVLAQAQALLEWSRESRRGPYLLMGDFNIGASLFASNAAHRFMSRLAGTMPDETATHRLLRSELNDAFSGRQPHSFPARSSPYRQKLPFRILPLKLDHAFVSRSARDATAEILPLRGSDHYPLWAGMALGSAELTSTALPGARPARTSR